MDAEQKLRMAQLEEEAKKMDASIAEYNDKLSDQRMKIIAKMREGDSKTLLHLACTQWHIVAKKEKMERQRMAAREELNKHRNEHAERLKEQTAAMDKKVEEYNDKLSDQRAKIIAKMRDGDKNTLLHLCLKDWLLVAKKERA